MASEPKPSWDVSPEGEVEVPVVEREYADVDQ
jgi:hypothetical protein